MFKYEQEIENANREYQEQRQICLDAYKGMADWFGGEAQTEVADVDEIMCRYIAFGDVEPDDPELIETYEDEKGSLSSNARIAIKKYYTFVEGEGYVRIKESNFFSIEQIFPAASLPVKEFDFANGKAEEAGLYFLGMIGRNPSGEDFYLVKIGCASNIKERVNQYRSYNPMIYHNNIIYCPEDIDLRTAEKEAHKVLADIAIARAAHAMEWFYVDKETYFQLCDNPWAVVFGEGD